MKYITTAALTALGSLVSMSALAQDEIPAAADPVPVEAPAAEAAVTPESTAAAEPVATIPLPEAEAPPVPEAAAPAASGNRLVQEIIVTAQKREENIRDVPIAITAFTPEKLDAFGVQSAQDLERITPGLTVTNAAGFNVAYLRGVGTDAFLPGADPSVPFYLDGVALLGAQGSSDTLGRIERIEVLKGPQGTLFGRNATGGAVSIITPNPENDFFADLKLEFGKYGTRNLLGYINVPIIDSLAVSLAGFTNERDNYYTNDTGPIIDTYARGGRAKLRWEASDTLAFTLAGSYQEASNNAGLTFELTRPAPILGAALPRDPQADRHVRFDSLSGARNEATLLSFTGEWNTSWFDTKLILSDQKVDAPFVRADFDKGPLPIVNIESIKQLAKQKSAELQVLSNGDTPFAESFEWVAGLYYLESSGGFDPIAFDVLPQFLRTLLPGGNQVANAVNGALALLNLPALGNGARLFNYGVLESESYSVYAQGTLNLLDSLKLTLGLRYQEESRDLKGSRTTVPQPNGSEVVVFQDEVPTLKAEQLSPRVAFQWRPFDPLTQIYLSWSRAYKSPTYNTVNLIGSTLGPIEPVTEEQVDSYELGVKTDLFDSALRIDAAVFFTEQKDLLTGFVAVASGGVVSYDNAGDAEILGFETDFLLSPLPTLNPGLILTGALSYLDTEYTDYTEGRGYDEATGLAFGDNGTSPLEARDFTGNRIVRTPKWTYTAGFNQRIQFGTQAIELGADLSHNSGFFFLPQNSDLYARESYHIVNARISYFYEPWDLQLTVYGQNLADEVYNEVVFVDDFGRNQVLNDPRVYGLRMNWTF
ncbi:MAG: TonB-dependent receptor [Panacagrimonas sp.]